MTSGLKRYYGTERLHFITCSCYRRRALLARPEDRDLFLTILEQVRQKYRLVVVGYVVMPEHFHVLMNEPEVRDPSVVMQVVKQRVACRLLPATAHFWYPRFYDFNVWSPEKRVEKLDYMHNNPVERGLVPTPAHWRWSSFRTYAYGEPGLVRINTWPKIQPLRRRKVPD